MPILTKKQQEAYNADPLKCPFCGSKDIDYSRIEVDGRTAWQEADCVKCGESWQDVYTFTEIYHAETEEHEAKQRKKKSNVAAASSCG